jgi:hypothetical protein
MWTTKSKLVKSAKACAIRARWPKGGASWVDGFLPALKKVCRIFVFLERLFAPGGYRGANTTATDSKRSECSPCNSSSPPTKQWLQDCSEAMAHGAGFGLARLLSPLDFEYVTRTQLAFVLVIELMMRRNARHCQVS